VSERILIVDDDPPVRRMLARTIGAEGYVVGEARDGAQALVAVESDAPDLVVLDVTMPGLDGFEVCRQMRKRGVATPVILVTARGTVADRVAGLDAGADDYLAKPFDSGELLARIRALLRRGRPPGSVRTAGALRLDTATRIVETGDAAVELTAREAALLELLMRRPNTVVTRERALREVWGDDAGLGVVDRYVAFLRSKLGDRAEIRTVRGVGYTFVA
jgi:two-component system, OmpR family, response regulator MprA